MPQDESQKYKLNQKDIRDIYGSKVLPDLANTKIQIEILIHEVQILQTVGSSYRVYWGEDDSIHNPFLYSLSKYLPLATVSTECFMSWIFVLISFNYS